MSSQGLRPPEEEMPFPGDELGRPEIGGMTQLAAESILRDMIGDPERSNPASQRTLDPPIDSTRGNSSEERILKAEIRYRTLVERIPAITFLASMDRNTQEFYVSPQIEAILGFSQKEWLENPILWYTQLHPDDRSRWQDEFARTVVVGTPFRSEYRFLARDGRVVWVRGEAQMVRDEAGNPLFLQGIAFDITDQKVAEDTLRHYSERLEAEVWRRTSELADANIALHAEIIERRRAERLLSDRESRLRSIVDSAVDGIILIDETGVVEAFNPAAEQIFGYSANEVLGRNVKMLMPTPYREEHDNYLANYRDTGVPRVIGIGRDATGRRRDGSTFPMELAVSVTLTGDGRKFTGIVRDVTERKRSETDLLNAKIAAETANRLKSEFLANMSHEIRTPMNGIIGMTELALNTELSRHQREYLEMVKCSADALLGLINDILDFSKIEADKLELEAIEFDLSDVVFNTLRSLAVRAHAKGLELACEIVGDFDDAVFGDPGRLRQVLINLVGNAIKFTDTGEIVVVVCRETSPAHDPPAESADRAPTVPGPLLRFSVRDTGIGISIDKHDLIFDPFTQADGSTTRRFGGTGLGLSISRSLVEQMGGRIWVESEVGLGTTFHFTLRLTPVGSPISSLSPVGVAELSGRSILIVDDNATSRKILEKTVLQWGMRPTLADSGPTAWLALKRAAGEQRPFPVVLLDATMPEMDGFALLRHFGSDDNLPCATIMMLSSAAQLSELVRAEALNLSGYLMKPVRRSELVDAIRKTLSHDLASSMAQERLAKPDAVATERLRVLLAEDNPVNQKLAVHILEKQGHTVVVANDGMEACLAFEAGKFDLVLMDIQMPVMDGFQAAAAIRRAEERTGRHVPVIALTANAMKGDRERCLQNGFDDYISKPIQWRELEAIIRRLKQSAGPEQTVPTRVDRPPASIFDVSAVLDQLGDDRELLRDIAALFLDECPRMIALIEDAIGRRDPKGLTLAARRFKEEVSHFASESVVTQAQRLETMGIEGDLTGSTESFAALKFLVEPLTQALVALIETGQRPPITAGEMSNHRQ